MHRDNIHLSQIRDSINLIIEYTNDINYRDFEQRTIVQDAVIRRFEIISYACDKLAKDLKEKFDQIPWERIINIKDKLLEEDYSVNTVKVWEIVKEDLSIFRDDINKVIHDTNR